MRIVTAGNFLRLSSSEEVVFVHSLNDNLLNVSVPNLRTKENVELFVSAAVFLVHFSSSECSIFKLVL